MVRRPPVCKVSYTLFPYTSLFRSLVTGLVQQVDYRSVILDLGDAEAILPGSERIPFERLERGNRVKALILEVRNEAKGRSEEHTSELQSLMRTSSAVLCLKKKHSNNNYTIFR